MKGGLFMWLEHRQSFISAFGINRAGARQVHLLIQFLSIFYVFSAEVTLLLK